MSTAHILIVDDERFVRDSLVEMLSAEGFRVTTASSGSEALKRLAAESFDAIVSDLRMQKGDGLQLLTEAKSRANPIVSGSAIASVTTKAGTPRAT